MDLILKWCSLYVLVILLSGPLIEALDVELTSQIALVGTGLQLSCVCKKPGRYAFLWTRSAPGSNDPSLEVGLFQPDCSPFGPFNTDLYNISCSENDTTFHLTIVHAALSNNNEMWRCQATAENGETGFALAPVTVHAPPTSPRFLVNNTYITSPGPVTAIRGMDASIACFSTSNPPPDYKWTLPNGTVVNRQDLTIENVQVWDEGEYRCLVNNTMTPSGGDIITGMNSSTVQLRMLYPPQCLQIEDQYFLEGSDVRVTCPFVRGKPVDTEFTWTDSEGHKVRDGSRLLLPDVRRSDEGLYKCTARNIMIPSSGVARQGVDSTEFYLTILYQSEVTNFTVAGHGFETNITTLDGPDLLNFSCSADGNPKGNITLLRDSSEVTWAFGDTLQHGISRDCENNGVYICTAGNGYNGKPSVSQPIHLSVYCSPRPDAATSRPQTHVKVAESSSLTLTFRVLAYPVPSFLWQRLANDSWQLLEHNNNNTITHSTDVSNGGLQSSLRIVNVSFSDYGVYNLNISNEVGSYDVNFTVSAPDGPDAPTKVTYTTVTRSSVELRWLAGNDGGDRQTFYIEYRKEGDSEWMMVDPGLGVSTADLTHTLTGLSSGTVYEVRIFARNRYGVSERSNTVYFQTSHDDVTLPTKKSREANSTGILIGLLVGGIVVVVLGSMVIAILICRKYRSRKEYVVSSSTRSSSFKSAPTAGVKSDKAVGDTLVIRGEHPKTPYADIALVTKPHVESQGSLEGR